MTLLWPYDVSHIGNILEKIRQSRNLQQVDIARLGQVSEAAISRLESGETKRVDQTLEGYIKALRSQEVADKLTEKQADIVNELYRFSRNNARYTYDLTVYHFDLIKSMGRPPELGKLVAALKREQRPAIILDPLWFGHVVNGALLRLFDLKPESEHLNHWAAWHSLGTKLLVDSPVRKGHANKDEYLPPTINMFFLEENNRQYLFTPQKRAVLYRLYKLSEKYNYDFASWWSAAISFLTPYELESMTRSVKGQGDQRFFMETSPLMFSEIELSPGHTASYTLIVWNPIGTDAEQAFESISRSSWSHDIFYAADYDKNGDFHPNTWPEVKPSLPI